jgi:formiminotetrahydrofolate cyclodeaminase
VSGQVGKAGREAQKAADSAGSKLGAAGRNIKADLSELPGKDVGRKVEQAGRDLERKSEGVVDKVRHVKTPTDGVRSGLP